MRTRASARTKTFLILTALAVFIGGGSALAAPSVDTLLTAGYDPEELTVFFGASPRYDADSEFEANNTNSYDCDLVGEYEYELNEDAEEDATSVLVTGLTSTDAPTEVGASDPEDASDTFFHQEDEEAEGDDVLDPVEYGEEGAEECDLTAVLIGEDANHGKVVSGVVHALKDMGFKGAGCLIRHFAQSEWGKEEVTEADSEDLTVTLAAFQASCNHGKPSGDDEDGGNGRPDWAGQGKPPWAGPDGDKSLKPGKGGPGGGD